jgi:CRP-like cAMP-binding protein
MGGAPVRSGNRLLASLPHLETARLGTVLRRVRLERGQILTEPGSEIEHLFFPDGGTISLLVVMRDGRAIEAATLGREGVVGAMAGLGPHITATRAMVLIGGTASRIAAIDLRKAVQISPVLRDRVVHYNEALLAQVQITAACNALHPIEARLARWILQTSDRIGADEVPLTQELLAEHLGARRSSVSEMAGRLQADGLIRHSRGLITITDRIRLEAAVCECYTLIGELSGLLSP